MRTIHCDQCGDTIQEAAVDVMVMSRKLPAQVDLCGTCANGFNDWLVEWLFAADELVEAANDDRGMILKMPAEYLAALRKRRDDVNTVRMLDSGKQYEAA
jgi:hypothetical protein